MNESPLASWLREQDRAARPAEQVTDRQPAGPPPWEHDEDPVPPRRWLPLLVAVPWVFVLVLALVLLAGDSDAPVTPAAEVPKPPTSPTPPPKTPARGDPDPAIAEAGALLVRAALSGGVGSDGATRYVDGAVVTDLLAVGDAWVVTVLALVLEGGEHGWERTALERQAVAVRQSTAGPVAVAGPWTLPASPHPPPQATTPVDDPALRAAAAAALAAAEYRGLGAIDLSRDPELPGVLLARFDAVPPGSDTPGSWTAWLLDSPDPVLLGGGVT